MTTAAVLVDDQREVSGRPDVLAFTSEILPMANHFVLAKPALLNCLWSGHREA
ncbi:MAG: hypothetical protein WA474_21735 [Candidatus Sulfotelmatobacter sp.]